jgi:general L-amino acid transport system permease protein
MTAEPIHSLAYVRSEEAPSLPPPRSMVGIVGWLRTNLFSSVTNSILTLVALYAAYWVITHVAGWAIVRAVWTGENREACTFEGVGACWPFAKAKFAQWIYGFYPIDQRWRINLVFLLGLIGLVPMLMPSVPYKRWNALYLLIGFPIASLILLTGGNFNISAWTFLRVLGFLGIIAAFLPIFARGFEGGLPAARPALILVAAGVAVWLLGFLFIEMPAVETPLGALSLGRGFSILMYIAAGIYGLTQTNMMRTASAASVVLAWSVLAAGIILIMILLRINFGLVPVETSQWGGLTLTLIVSVTAIVCSFPLGILLALGRRSDMPVIKYFCISFIEVMRGMPLITVLFMASVLLPLFLPPGTNFDKLTRALILTIMFSSAYMAEVIRGGLQAIPKGQSEAARALGLSYWQDMALITLPQAIKIVIPGIVNTFIGLFKDTTLVTVIGLFDLQQMIISGFADANWASPATGATGYMSAAAIFWVFCFGMSRYSQFIERRLNTGHRR